MFDCQRCGTKGIDGSPVKSVVDYKALRVRSDGRTRVGINKEVTTCLKCAVELNPEDKNLAKRLEAVNAPPTKEEIQKQIDEARAEVERAPMRVQGTGQGWKNNPFARLLK